MKKKQITKLFAVMAMAASPAAASTANDPWATSAEVAPLDDAAASEAMAAVISIGYAAISHSRPPVAEAPARSIQASPSLVAARPRTTPSGAPACGNVATRAPRPVDCTPSSQVIMAGTPVAPSPTIATPRPASAPAERPLARTASTGGAR